MIFIFYFLFVFFFFNDTATTEIYTLSLHDALPISYVMKERARFWTKYGKKHEIPFQLEL